MGFLDRFIGGKKDAGSETATEAKREGSRRDPRKARKFFDYAKTVADTGNYDYAIECYINGLKHDPDNMTAHEELLEVAQRRKVKGGKPEGFSLGSGGKTALEKMLHAEKRLAKDPLNVKVMRDVMKYAVAADEEEPEVNLAQVAYWVGSLLLDFNTRQAKPSKNLYLEARDLFREIEAFDKAVEACRYAVRLDQNNSVLLGELKDLEAENTMQQGGYNRDNTEEGGFRNFVRDGERQRALEQEDAVTRTDATRQQVIERTRAEYEEDPMDMDKLQKLVDALLQLHNKENEQEAIDLLKRAWEETGQYRYKVRIGDIQMRQMNRILRELKGKVDASPDDEALKKNFEEARRRQLVFELQEFTERVKNYPTDMGLRFEMGRRLFASGQLDEAIGAFQQAKSDPKHRAQSHWYLGQCYLNKDWYDEAVATLQEGVESYAVDNDKLGLELRYLLMHALTQGARRNKSLDQAKEAQQWASKLLQTDINFKDIKTRMNEVKALVSELQGS